MANFYDQYLLYRIRTKRDKQAFGKIYDRYVTAIFRFVLLKLPSKEMAEDVTAETFLRCWQYIQENKDIANIRAFLYKIARNLVVDSYRKMESTPSLSVTIRDDETSSIMQLEFSDQKRAQSEMETRAEIRLVLERIAKLKEDYRDVLTLRLVDGLSFGDIAKILEKTSGNVRVIYHRAMKALEHLEEHTHEPPRV